MVFVELHREPQDWLDDFKKIMDTPAGKQAIKLTIADIAERSNDPTHLTVPGKLKNMVPTSPRSVESCLRCGTDPYTLVHRPLDTFIKAGHHPEAAQLMFDESEAIRKEKIDRLVKERATLVELDEQGRFKPAFGAARKAAAARNGDDDRGSEMVEKEAKRLAMLKERQQRELEQQKTYEQTMLQRQMANQEALQKEQEKEAEERRKRQEREREWQAAQRERELKKAEEEELQAKEQRRLDQIKYEREIQEAAAAAEEESPARCPRPTAPPPAAC
mmetsp:Transcript_16025/g.41621  ORF Transcript_16025/g.41621 Transcript_16025/m.41621 type:complete len:275 (+) Transcript_16025:157-981(+)